MSLAWNASTDDVSGVTGYQVFRGTERRLVGTPTGLTFTDTGLTASTTYSYTVRAVDATAKVSAASAAVPRDHHGGDAGLHRRAIARLALAGAGGSAATTLAITRTNFTGAVTVTVGDSAERRHRGTESGECHHG